MRIAAKRNLSSRRLLQKVKVCREATDHATKFLLQVASKKRPHSTAATPSKTENQTPVEIKEEDEDEDDEPILKRPRRNGVTSKDEEQKPELELSDAPATPTKTQKQRQSAIKKENGTETTGSSKVETSTLTNAQASSTPELASEVEEEVDDDDEDEDKLKVAAKILEQVQTTLKTTSKDPYPDWKPGEPVPYAALCTTFSLIEMTTKRLIIAAHCSLFLRQVLRLTPDDLLPTVLLMINKLAADYAGIELGIGESLIMKAIGEATGRSLAVIKQDQKEIGDLGLVAVKSRSKQPTMFKAKPLTVRGVLKSLLDIATTQGNGAQGRKVDGIKKLLSAADAHMSSKVDITKDKGGASEAKFIVRFLEGKLRLGLAEKTVLTSLSQAMVYHEVESNGMGKAPSIEQMAKGESVLKAVHR